MLVFMVNIFIQHFQKIFQTITCSFQCVCPRPTKPVRWKLKIMFSKFATPEAREELRSLAARLVLQESPLQSLDIHPTCQAFSSLTIAVLAEPTKKRAESHDTLMHTFRGPAVFSNLVVVLEACLRMALVSPPFSSTSHRPDVASKRRTMSQRFSSLAN